jgi:hypothetical protein
MRETQQTPSEAVEPTNSSADMTEPIPEELQEDPEEEAAAKKEKMLEMIEQGQTRWQRFVQTLRELPRTMKNVVGVGGLEGFRSRKVRGLYTALRLALLLGGSAEALKSMAKQPEDQPSDLDKIVQLAREAEHGQIDETPLYVSDHRGNMDESSEGDVEEFKEPTLTDILIPLSTHTDVTEVQKYLNLSESRLHENQATLERLASGGDLKLQVREFGVENSDVLDVTSFPLSSEQVSEFTQSPQVLNGFLETITATIYSATLSDEQRRLFVHFMSNKLHRLKDSYGNTVFPQDDGSIKIYIPYPFDVMEKQGESTRTFAPVEIKLDLTPIGLGTFEGSMYSQPPEHVGIIGEGNYHLWTSADLRSDGTPDGDQRYENILETVKGYAAGVARVEKFFGLVPGTAAERFHVVPAENENAAAVTAYTSPSTIVITTSDAFQDHRKMDPEILGQHETAHLMGALLDHADEGDSWSAFFDLSSSEAFAHLIGKENEEDVKKELEHIEKTHGTEKRREMERTSRHGTQESTINEEDFYDDLTMGGHAFDNPSELFASQMNALLDPEWEQKMLSFETNEQFLRWQLHALETLRGLFQNHPKIPADAPVFDDLNAKIVFLQKITNL